MSTLRTIHVSGFVPTVDVGRAVRTYGVVRALAAHGPVDLVHVPFGPEHHDPAYDAIDGVRIIRVPSRRDAGRGIAFTAALAAGAPKTYAKAVVPSLVRTPMLLARRARDRGEDVRIVADGLAAALGLGLAGAARRYGGAYLAHNLESSFRHELESGALDRRRLQRFERRILRLWPESWMVSDADMAGARALWPDAGLRLVPNVVDVDAIVPLPPRRGERMLLFVGDHRYEPNVEAAQFLIDGVMPLLWQQAPDVTLTIAGRGSDALHAADPRVRIAGFVDSLTDLYAAAGAVLVPLLTGGGSPLKFIEALAHRLPVVATPRAAAGLRALAGEHFVGADAEPAAFAEGILTALRPEVADPLAGAGRALVEREYSIRALVPLVGP